MVARLVPAKAANSPTAASRRYTTTGAPAAARLSALVRLSAAGRVVAGATPLPAPTPTAAAIPTAPAAPAPRSMERRDGPAVGSGWLCEDMEVLSEARPYRWPITLLLRNRLPIGSVAF